MSDFTITTSDTTIGMRDEALFPINIAVNDKATAESLNICITDEGVIIDCYRSGELVGTRGMTFDEWFTFVIAHDPLSPDPTT